MGRKRSVNRLHPRMDVDTVLRSIEAPLPVVARRAGRDVLRLLAREIAGMSEESPLATRWAEHLVGLTEERRALRRAASSDAALLRTAVLAGDPERAFQTLLPRWPSRTGGRARPTQRPAWFDRTALEDRLVDARHRADQRWEFLAVVVAANGYGGVPDAFRTSLNHACIEFAADRSSAWTVRVAALRLLAVGEPTADPNAAPSAGVELLLDLLRDGGEDPWVISAAAETLAALRPAPDAVRTLRRAFAIEEANRGPDHALARARLLAQLARLSAWDAVTDALSDPSEHVRISAARWLATSPRREDALSLAGLLARSDEPYWRAAAAGAVAWLDRMVEGDVRDVGPLTLGLSAEPHPRTVGVVLDALWRRRAALEPLAPALLESGGPAWHRLESRTDLSTDARRALALIRVWLPLASDPRGLERIREADALLRGSAEGDVVVADRGALAQCTARELLDVLFLIAHDDLDMVARPRSSRDLALDVAPAGGWEIEIGLRRKTRSWRVAHEITHPRNDKRQAWPHTHDEAPEGPVVAWSGRMSEVVATSVAGRRVASPTQLDWAEHLPPVATLYAAKRWGVAWARTADGLSVVEAQPDAHDLTTRFVPLADLRQRLATSEPGRARADWQKALAKEGYRWTQAPPLHAIAAGWRWWTDIGVSDASSERDAALIGAASIAAWGATRLTEELRVRRAREALPLVVGGWGSRGKSSVERMKAAMFQGMGYSVLCKSTGCEAMILLGTPGAEAQEVFLYRARDKASLHEQRRIMDAAAVLRPQVFVYESMALNPAYTELLQQGWMHDDYTTITNTYPDHEDVQGPSGRDVADVIAAFTPVRGTLLTTEQHMTPVLARRATANHSRFVGCGPEHWELLARDLLDRFPDWAYDRNVALVAALGAELGIPEDEAIRAMADHVVVDLGAFKTYGPLDVEARSLRFLCGNSANDRASFLSNWERARLDDVPPRSGLTDWQIVVFNNRGDRLARQAMFAKIAAMDTCADRIVLIGTNVLPMRDQIVRAIREHTIPEWVRLGEGPDGRRRLATELARRLRRPPLPPEDQPARTSGARPPIADEADWYTTQVAWSEECAWLDTLATTDTWSVEAVARQAAERLTKRLLAFPNPKITGDQILERLATLVPAGSRVDILGAQNIRGTGLDLVYRWTSVDKVSGWLDDVVAADPERVREGLMRLTTWDGWGHWDAKMAEGVLRAHAAKAEAAGLDEEWQAALAIVSRWCLDREQRLRQGAATTGGFAAAWAATWRKADVFGSVRRRWKADRLYRDLVRFDIGRARAADEARRLLEAERA